MNVGLLVNREKPAARRFLAGFVEWLSARGHRPVLAPGTARAFGIRAACRPPGEIVRAADLVVALGGDGTLLRAARLVGASETPIMGVNLGGLGFLTEFSTGEARAGVTAFARGRHREERRMALACRLGRRRGFAVNDCAVNMGRAGRVIKVIVRADGEFINRFSGDGIVIATPTGSTAYSLAAGGPVVVPTMAAIVLTPLAPHALAARPLILPADAALEVELAAGSDPATLNIDGQQVWPLRPGRPFAIGRAGFCVRLVTPHRKSWYGILRDKLKWRGSQV
ncbi:MAG: NAD(+)/NADH kinase [bacterium]